MTERNVRVTDFYTFSTATVPKTDLFSQLNTISVNYIELRNQLTIILNYGIFYEALRERINISTIKQESLSSCSFLNKQFRPAFSSTSCDLFVSEV